MTPTKNSHLNRFLITFCVRTVLEEIKGGKSLTVDLFDSLLVLLNIFVDLWCFSSAFFGYTTGIGAYCMTCQSRLIV
jgi:hypothetical protein